LHHALYEVFVPLHVQCRLLKFPLQGVIRYSCEPVQHAQRTVSRVRRRRVLEE